MGKLLTGSVLIMALLVFLSCASVAAPGALPTAAGEKPVTSARQPSSSEWERTLEAAAQEKMVVVYTTGGAEIRTALTNAFKARHGLDLEFVVGRGAELNQKFLTERRSGLFIGDVNMTGSTAVIQDLLPVGALDPIRPELVLPEVADVKYWYGGKLPFVEKGEYLFGFRGSVFWPFTINTDLVKREEMVSYRDLLNPRFKGKIVMGDPTFEGPVGTFLTMVGEDFMGYDFIRDLAKQEPFLSRNERLMTEWVARGKYDILIGTKPDPITEFQRAGAPLQVIIPKEGSIIEPGAGTISVVNKRPHPNATRVFVNWLLGKEGQTVYAVAAGTESAREDVSKAHLDPKLAREPGKVYIFGDEEKHKIQEGNYKRWAEIFGPLLK